MKKAIWIPLAVGGTLGLLDFISTAVNFIIPLGPFSATGPQEILVTISAAIGGPLGLLVAGFLQELGIYFFYLTQELSPGQMLSTGLLFSTADFGAHLVPLLVVAYCYRFLHQRAQKVFTFFGGWVLIIVIYYTLLVLMQFILIGSIVPDRPALAVLYRNNLPEFLVVLVITTLIWIALPRRFHRPLWIEGQPATQAFEDRA